MSLTTSIVAAWHLDEASGNATDSVGTNTLTDNNSVGSGTGILSGARQFTRSSSKYFTHANSGDLASPGDIDFTFCGWIKLDTLSRGVVVAKTDSGNGEYFLFYDETVSRLAFSVYGGVSFTSGHQVNASSFGALSTGVWYFVRAWHDSVANTINIQINDGAVDSVSHSSGVFATTGSFYVGGDPFGDYFDGLIDELVFWKRVLTSGEGTQLYNSGSGLAYPFSGGGAVGGIFPHYTRRHMRGGMVAARSELSAHERECFDAARRASLC